MLDQIKAHFGHNPKSAGKAIELWLEYEETIRNTSGWSNTESFLINLDDGDRDILEQILSLQADYEMSCMVFSENIELKKQLSLDNSTPPSNPQHPTTTEDDISLKLACKEFLKAKEANKNAKSSVKGYAHATNQLQLILYGVTNNSELMISQITAKHIRKFVELMSKLPKNHTKKSRTKGMSAAGLIKLLDSKSADQLIADDLEPLAPKTINQRFGMIRELMSYLENQQYPIQPKLENIVRFTGKGGHKPKKKRRPYNSDELKLLFESNRYKLCKFKDPCDYWTPLIALFTGATQSEIVQLHTSDVYQMDNIWVIDINDDDDKRLKNLDGRKRIVPIHSQLIELGFDRFVKQCKSSGLKRLFPSEERDDTDQFDAYSKRFNRFKRRVGVKPAPNEMLDFHSFRHLASTQLIGKGCDEGVVNDIIGHRSAIRSETRKTYAEGAFIAVKAEVIQKLEFDIDFVYEKYWGEIEETV